MYDALVGATSTTHHFTACAKDDIVPKLAPMPVRHDKPDLPAPLVTEASGDELRVGLPEGAPATFLLICVPSLTRRTVAEILDRARQTSQRRCFVSYGHGSGEARDALRAAGISFAGGDGRIFVRAPGIFVEHDERQRRRPAAAWDVRGEDESSMRNPFAKRSSRVPRWLLLHHARSFSVTDLAHTVDLNPAAVSRVVRGLEEAAFVRDAKSDGGGRRRNVRLERPRALLEAWLPFWQRRRIRYRHWDIGAHDSDEALSLLGEAVRGRPEGWAIGGVAGAAMVRRAVEPAEILVWSSTDDVAALADLLQPEPARGGRGIVRVAVAPDPWTLSLASPVDGLRVADPVQLWLDCASEGERALEAADAVAEVAGWS